MRIDLPQCNFKLCRKCFDGNCTGSENNRQDCETFKGSFDLESFKKELAEWHDFIKKDLAEAEFDIHLRIVNDVLESVECMIYDNTLFIE